MLTGEKGKTLGGGSRVKVAPGAFVSPVAGKKAKSHRLEEAEADGETKSRSPASRIPQVSGGGGAATAPAPGAAPLSLAELYARVAQSEKDAEAECDRLRDTSRQWKRAAREAAMLVVQEARVEGATPAQVLEGAGVRPEQVGWIAEEEDWEDDDE